MGDLSLSSSLLFWNGVYILLLITIGALGRRAKKENTLSDHFLAGRSIGLFVLVLTLFATQYSGNSLSAFPGKTHRSGLSYFMCVPFMVAIITGYLLFVPRLYPLSRIKKYITPTDFLEDRFHSSTLNYLSAMIFTIALCNYMLAQLKALGHAFSGLTENQIPEWIGIVGGAGVILIYELLGGMRAVAWTDALQGLVMAVGLVLVIGLIILIVGTPGDIFEQVQHVSPEKVENPGWLTCFKWLSTILLLGLGGPLYPQAIQRIYAAVNLNELKKAFSMMAFIPLFAVTSVVFIGVTGIALFPELEGVEADKVTFKVLAYLLDHHTLAYFPVLLVMMAVGAAIMSTADSCLLSLASIFTKDFVARFKKMDSSQAERLTRYSSFFSVLIITVLVLLALSSKITLWKLLEIKFEILIQLSPAFVLGTLHNRDDPKAYRGRDILVGLFTGLVFTLILYLAGHKSLFGFHCGVVGVGLNYLAVVLSRRFR